MQFFDPFRISLSLLNLYFFIITYHFFFVPPDTLEFLSLVIGF